MTRKIFAELNRQVPVRPICWNSVGHRYTDLGETELRFLTRPFDVHSHAMARPDWRGHDPLTEFFRLVVRRPVKIEEEIKADDVFLVPDIFRDSRRNWLPDFLKSTPARKIAIFHDATDLRLTSIYGDRGKKSRPYVEALALFDLVVCVSEEAHRDLRHFWKEYGCSATETRVELWPGDLEGAMQGADAGPANNSVVYVSSFHARKNHLRLLRVAEQLWREGLGFELKLIGRNVDLPFNKVVREIWKLQMRGRPLRWLRHVNEETLLHAYRECRFTVYPSLMEGYGLPIEESLLHGKPCVCGENGALGEVARGGGCLIVDQTSDDSLADGIRKLLSDQQLYLQLCAEARARKFRSWSDYIGKLLDYMQRPAGSLTPARLASN